ncbi:hypothetical protein DXG01_010683 [Tephrocybe rancida]|nr:hypothetical protein DXG01_010683 [Tephrocybe rancida]
MVREWRYLRMLKRGARGHEEKGIETIKPRACGVECPACPIPDKNMADGWKETPEHKKWLNALFIGIDGNFHLKRKDVSSDAADPDLGDGFAYFVKEKLYKEHLERHKDEVEPKSNCSRHDAVNLANSKSSQGHAATGVGTIECTRHDMKRPCLVGDFQVGKRVLNSGLKYFVVSYDIACQWSVNLCKRMLKLDNHFFMLDSQVQVHFFIPKFHLSVHVSACQTSFSFDFGVGVGRTDGEAPEQGWAEINPLASSSRQDVLDGHFGDYNWRKVISIGHSLLWKFKAATADMADHVIAHSELNASLPKDLLRQWTVEVEAWENNPSQPNPLVSVIDTPTQASVHWELAQAKATNVRTVNEMLLDERVSPSVLITCGLDIEAEQCVTILVNVTSADPGIFKDVASKSRPVKYGNILKITSTQSFSSSVMHYSVKLMHGLKFSTSIFRVSLLSAEPRNATMRNTAVTQIGAFDALYSLPMATVPNRIQDIL